MSPALFHPHLRPNIHYQITYSFFAFAVHLTTNMFAGEPKSSHWASTVSAVAVVLVAVVVAAIVAVAVIFILRNRA